MVVFFIVFGAFSSAYLVVFAGFTYKTICAIWTCLSVCYRSVIFFSGNLWTLGRCRLWFLVDVSWILYSLQMSSLPMLPTLAPLERVFLLLMSQLEQSANVLPASMLRMLNQTGVLFVSSSSPPLMCSNTLVEWFSLKKLSTRRQPQVLRPKFLAFILWKWLKMHLDCRINSRFYLKSIRYYLCIGIIVSNSSLTNALSSYNVWVAFFLTEYCFCL